MKRPSLYERLDDALSDLYHNSTPAYPTLESDFEQDLFYSWFEFEASDAVADLAYDERFATFVKRYGPVYTYGRGGRTVAPSKLMTRSSHAYPERAERLDIAPLEMRALIKTLAEFNRAVAAWNAGVAQRWSEYIDLNDLQTEIDSNKGKRRTTRTVYR